LPELEVFEAFGLNQLSAVSGKEASLLKLDGDLQPVTATISRRAPLVLSLVTHKDTIGVTPEHRFFSYDRQDWVPAGKLKVGERLSTRSGVVNLLRLDTMFHQLTPVYNLEVRRNHTYHVGKNELLVHNAYGRRMLERIRNPGYTPDANNKWANFVKNMDQQRLDQFLIELNIAKVGKVDNRVKLVRAWEVLYSKAAWRINTDYLTKVSRYKNAGLDVVDEGGELIVKQADGVRVGKLDPNDPYYPGEMKVKGEVSGRHFDPDLAGGLIVKKSWANPSIIQQGIDDITTHLSRFGNNSDNANMISRLNQIKNGDIPITDFDKRFYTHELEEYARYRNLGIQDGLDPPGVWDNAHAASLETYSVNELASPLYHP